MNSIMAYLADFKAAYINDIEVLVRFSIATCSKGIQAETQEVHARSRILPKSVTLGRWGKDKATAGKSEGGVAVLTTH